ncbi:MAG: hypothetical protein KYQ20_01120 [Candidatus Nealsonbacteria bacterium]|nr:hypothetical protein [Candidatus Nealsonbacteria bacterium]
MRARTELCPALLEILLRLYTQQRIDVARNSSRYNRFESLPIFILSKHLKKSSRFISTTKINGAFSAKKGKMSYLLNRNWLSVAVGV